MSTSTSTSLVAKKPDLRIELPYKFEARDYQRPLLHALETDGYKRAVVVWHRRAGKDKTFLNHMIPAMVERKGYYVYFFPTNPMGRKVLWDGMDRMGMKFLEHFPEKLIVNVNNTEMKITLRNGSIFQVIGTDRIEQVGINPIGCVFSEFSLQSPLAWDLVRPILAENGGWAIFNFTPRGRNHAHDLLQMAQRNKSWYCEVLTVDDTRAISQEAIQDEVDAGMSPDMVQQEFYCSFNLGAEGSYYGKYMDRAMREGRIGNIDYDQASGVYTFWDLGYADKMAIWFVQFIGKEVHFIDYMEGTGEGLGFYIKAVQDKPYIYMDHFAPHDIKVHELSTGLTRVQRARELGIDFQVVPMLNVEHGIELVRGLLDQCWFDEKKCEMGIRALESYRKMYNEKNQVYNPKPLHDWCSDAADAARYVAVIYRGGLMAFGGNMNPDDVRKLTNQYGPPVGARRDW